MPPAIPMTNALKLQLAGMDVSRTQVVMPGDELTLGNRRLRAVVALGWFGGDDAAFWAYVLIAMLIGFEGGTFHRRALRHRGWQHAGDYFATEPDLAIVEALKRK